METGESNSKLIIKEKDFNDNNIDNYHLSVEISHQTISYCIIDTNKRRCKLLFTSKYDNNNLVEFINGDKYLSQDFQSISVSIVNFPNTLVPISLYNEKDKSDLFSLNHSTKGQTLFFLSSKSLMYHKAMLLQAFPWLHKKICNAIYRTKLG